MVRPELTTAIDQCIEAASHEFNTENQKMLMTVVRCYFSVIFLFFFSAFCNHTESNFVQAAQFGKTFAEHYDPEGYVRMCRTLRVLNAARDPKIGIFLTYPQYVLYFFDKKKERNC